LQEPCRAAGPGFPRGGAVRPSQPQQPACPAGHRAEQLARSVRYGLERAQAERSLHRKRAAISA